MRVRLTPSAPERIWADGGIGIRVRFRSVSEQSGGGSSPLQPTSSRGGIGIRDSLRSYARKGVGVRVSPRAHYLLRIFRLNSSQVNWGKPIFLRSAFC